MVYRNSSPPVFKPRRKIVSYFWNSLAPAILKIYYTCNVKLSLRNFIEF